MVGDRVDHPFGLLRVVLRFVVLALPHAIPVDFSMPRFSSFAIIRGRTDSDDEVPSTISSSSLM